MAEFKTGVWRYFSAFNAFKDGQVSSGNDVISCRPWISTDGVVRGSLYVGMCGYVDWWYNQSAHSLKYTQLYSALTVIPSLELLSNYNVNNYSDSSPLTYTNEVTYNWDGDNKVTVSTIVVSMTNSTSSAVSINSLLFRKRICINTPPDRGRESIYVDAIMMAYYFDEPLVVLPNSTETYTVTIKTK